MKRLFTIKSRSARYYNWAAVLWHLESLPSHTQLPGHSCNEVTFSFLCNCQGAQTLWTPLNEGES